MQRESVVVHQLEKLFDKNEVLLVFDVFHLHKKYTVLFFRII